jgi:hypothetical protein
VVAARDYKLTNNTTSFTVTAPGPGVVVLTEAFEDGNFRVFLNGKLADYFRVNHAFKGIRIEQAGEYRVTFSYWPRYLTPALIICGIGVLVFAATLLILLRSVRLPRLHDGDHGGPSQKSDAVALHPDTVGAAEDKETVIAEPIAGSCC